MVVDPQYNRGTDCMPFPCFFLADGKGVCYTVCYEKKSSCKKTKNKKENRLL